MTPTFQRLNLPPALVDHRSAPDGLPDGPKHCEPAVRHGSDFAGSRTGTDYGTIRRRVENAMEDEDEDAP